jgi:4-carboxymuconolactone decarboxylase
MPLIPYANIEQLPSDVKATFERLPARLNIMKMLANAETCFAPFLQFGTALLSKQQLDPALREIVILQVAHIEGGEYEWVQHVPIGIAVGVTQQQIDAIKANRFDAECFSDRDLATMKLAKEVVNDVRASEESVRNAAKFLSARELVEVMLTIGNYMMAARLTETMRVEIDPPAGPKVLEALKRMS